MRNTKDRYGKKSKSKNYFIIGLGSIFDVWGSYFNYHYAKSDSKAIRDDWKVLGKDFEDVMEKYNPMKRSSRPSQYHY